MEGIKYDDGKLRWSLLPLEEIEQVIDVLEFGAKKYKEDNWKKVALEENGAKRYFNACLRHVISSFKGEILDKESKKSHLAHAICCLLFWLWLENQKGKSNGL
jgi:hypothetical protein